MKRTLSFSGGLTSGFMLKRALEQFPNYRSEFITLFENTGKERKETLDFVHEVETKWEVPIIWLEYISVPASQIPAGIFPTKRRNENLSKAVDASENAHWFKIVDYERAARKSEPFDSFLSQSSALPNATGRGCSAQLKIRTGMRYLFSLGIHEFEANIGIRSDESHRAIEIQATCESFLHPQFPLIDAGITIAEVENFWKLNDFTLNLKNYEGNCDLCFLKAKWKRMRLMKDNPGMADWWIEKEKHFEEAHPNKRGRSGFRLGETYEGILSLANYPEMNFDESEQDVACSCAEKGFEKEIL